MAADGQRADVRDIAEATAAVLTQQGHLNNSYDLTGPESLSFHDVAVVLSDEIDAPVTYHPVSSDAARQAMIANGMPIWDAEVLAEIQALFATGAYAEVKPDVTELIAHPARSFRQFASDYRAAFA